MSPKTGINFFLLLIALFTIFHLQPALAEDVVAEGDYHLANNSSSPYIPFYLLHDVATDSWSMSKVPGYNGPSSQVNGRDKIITCNGRICISAVQTGGPVLQISYDQGATWSVANNLPSIPDSYAAYYAVKCSDKVCIANGVGSKYFSIITSDNGASWALSQNFLNNFTCNNNFCLAVGIAKPTGDDPDNHVKLPLYISQDAGNSWSAFQYDLTKELNDYFSWASADGLACHNKTCVIVGDYTGGNTGSGYYLIVSHDQGQTWHSIKNIDNPRYAFTGNDDQLSCTDNQCLFVETDDNGLPVFYISTDEGDTWIKSPFDSQKLGNNCGESIESFGLSCMGKSCQVAMNCRKLLMTKDGGKSWQVSNFPKIKNIDYSLQKVICTDENSCVAGGDSGNSNAVSATPVLFTTKDGGLHWSQVEKISGLPVEKLDLVDLWGISK